MMRLRIVVADRSEARFYDSLRPGASLTLVRRIDDPLARVQDQEILADRPGRVFDHAPAVSGRRGAVPRHDTSGERRPRKHQATLFARRVVAELDSAQQEKRVDRIALIAPPAFLGLVRSEMSKELRGCVVIEVPKNLLRESLESIRACVSTQALSELHGRGSP